MPQTEAQQRQLDSYLGGAGAEFRPGFENVGGHWGLRGGNRVPYELGTRMRGGVGEQIFGGLFRGLFDMFDGGGLGKSGDTFEGGPLSGLLNALNISPLQSLQAPRTSPTPSARPTMVPAPAPAPMPEQSAAGVPSSPVSGAGLLGSVGVGAPNITGELGFGLAPMDDPSVAQFGSVNPVAIPGLLASDYNDAPPMTGVLSPADRYSYPGVTYTPRGGGGAVEDARDRVVNDVVFGALDTPEKMAMAEAIVSSGGNTREDLLAKLGGVSDIAFGGISRGVQNIPRAEMAARSGEAPAMPQDPTMEAPALIDAELPGLGLAFRSLDTRQPASETARNVRASSPTPQPDAQEGLKGLLSTSDAPATRQPLSFRSGQARPFGGSTSLSFGEQPEIRMSTKGMDALGPIKEVIGRAESGGGNYNMVYGNRRPPKPLTEMTVAEIRDYQRQLVRNGSPSSALGFYQFIGPTLQSLIDEGVVGMDEKFTPAVQDRAGLALMERRGLSAWREGRLSDEAFADRLAQEWAGLPTASGRSYYAGDGLNKATVGRSAVMAALGAMGGAEPASLPPSNMPLGGLLGELSRPMQDVRMSTMGTQRLAPVAELNIPADMGASRDAAVLNAVRAGHVSPMSLETTPVTIDNRYTQMPESVDRIVFDVGNAPVMLGQEGVLYPASFDGGPQVAAALGGAAPTRVIVDAGMDQGRSVPMPTQKPGPGMTSLEAAQRQSEAIRDKIDGLTFFNKEILHDGTFYGGVKPGGGLWQARPSRGGHSGDYADYSHSVRVVRSATVYPTNGQPYQVPVTELYADPRFARALGL